MTPEIAIVVSSRDWAEALHRFVADHGGARVRARVLDGREALDEGYAVLVAEDLTSFLTPRLMAELRRRGKRVLGVFDPVEPWGRERLRELGADDTIEATASPEEMLRAIEALAITATVDLDAELVELDGAPAARLPAGGGAVGGAGRGDSSPPARRPRRAPGPVVAVGGPAGAPGATEVALGLAQAALRSGCPAVLVDADDVAPSLAQRLGLALHPNLRTAIDVVEHWSGQLSDALQTTAGLSVLCGLPNPRDWAEVRPGEVVDVLDELAATHAAVIVNVGHRVEELGGLAGGPARYGVTRAVLGRADRTVGVAAPSPVGVARFLDWVADVRALSSGPVHTVVGRAPSAAFQRGELAQELARSFPPASLTFAPFDRRVVDAAWRGEPVRTGPFTRALGRLAGEVLAPPHRSVGGAVGDEVPA